MDKLKPYKSKIDSIDAKMIALFEHRMSFVKEEAQYKAKHDIKPDKKIQSSHIVEVVTSNACDTQVIEYTEGLLLYLYDAAKKYQHRIVKRKI